MFAYEMSVIAPTAGVSDPTLAIVSAATWDDLDPLEFERLRRMVRDSAGRSDRALTELPDVEIAKSLGAVEANGTVRAVRLLGPAAVRARGFAAAVGADARGRLPGVVWDRCAGQRLHALAAVPAGR